jgi:hypothetical protein
VGLGKPRARFGILMVKMSVLSFWTGMPCGLIDGYQHLEQACTTCKVRRAKLLQGKQMRVAWVEEHFLFIVR